MRRLVVLRPEPGASATVERARDRGLDAFAVPLFRIEPVPWRAPDADLFDGLLMTSANAVRHSGGSIATLQGLPVYAVGEATAEAARLAGFEISLVGDGGVDPLLASIEPGLRLLHLCGEDRRVPQAPIQVITPLIVYRAKPVEAPDLSLIDAAVVLVHSPRAGYRLAELVRRRASISIAAISEAAATSVGSGWAEVEIAEEPTDDALLALAARLCDKPGAE